MKNLFKSVLFGVGVALLMSNSALAKDVAKPSSSASASASAAAKAPLVDINSASKEDLAKLPKIGDARSEAIIKGRPYSGKDDLLKKKILPKDAYNAVKDLIIAKQAPKPAEKKK
jgi:DNA uptake protein ComE-like DNA-binding protein